MKKVKDSIFGVLIGIIFIIGGIFLIFWNEKNNVKNIKVIDELQKVVIDVKSDDIQTTNDNKLVNTSGKLVLSGNIVDTSFGVKVGSAILVRTVEMYQWKENCSTDDNNKKTCEYSKTWSSNLIDSNKFETKANHINPSYMSYKSETILGKNIKVGNYSLSDDQLKNLSTDKVYTDYTNLPYGYKKVGEYVTNASNYDEPEIGNLRIKYTYNDSTDVTVLAMQKGNNLIDYKTEQGTLINEIRSGIKSSSEMIQIIENSNNLLKWILRGASLLLEIIGIAAIFGPITSLTSYVPILGSLVGTATSLVGFLLGTSITLLCTAIAWILYRPLLGIILLAMSLLLFYILMSKGKKVGGN